MPIDLMNRRFTQCDMSLWTFEDAFLAGSVWTHVDLTAAKLVCVNFAGTRFERCSFKDTDLIYSASPTMIINGARLNLRIPKPKHPAVFRSPQQDPVLRDLIHAEHQRAPQQRVTITHEPGRRYVGCDLRRAIFHEVGLNAAYFRDVCCAEGTMTECNLNGALIDLSDMRNVQIIDSDIERLRINGTRVTDVMKR